MDDRTKNIVGELRAQRAWLLGWTEELESGRVKITREGEDETEAQAADSRFRLEVLEKLIAAYEKDANA